MVRLITCCDKCLEISLSSSFVSIDFHGSHVHIWVLKNAWFSTQRLDSFPPRLTEQTKVRAMIIKFHSKSDLPGPISLTLGFFPFTVVDSPRWRRTALAYFFYLATSAAHKCTKPTLMHAHTFHLCVHCCRQSRRGASSSGSSGAVQIWAQWDWLMSPGKQKEGVWIERRRRGQVVLSNPAPGWSRVRHAMASSDTDN